MRHQVCGHVSRLCKYAARKQEGNVEAVLGMKVYMIAGEQGGYNMEHVSVVRAALSRHVQCHQQTALCPEGPLAGSPCLLSKQ